MKRLGMIALVGAACGSSVASAQVVDIRVVERQGQISLLPGQTGGVTMDNVLNFAVQARVTGASGVGLRSLDFDIVMPCEPDSWGTLARLLTSNTDGSYAPNTAQTTNGTVGRGGLAAHYSFTALSDPNANGLLNASGGTHRNNFSSQDIGAIAALAQGQPLVRVLDLDGNGIPDTSPLNAGGQPVPEGSTAPLDSLAGQTYFGAGGNWHDVYRFKYTRTFVPQSCQVFLPVQVVPRGATVFSTVRFTSGAWEAIPIPVVSIGSTHALITGCLGGPPVCKADYNGDGVLNADDIFVYIADWFAGCDGSGMVGCDNRNPDYDCDGMLSVNDLFIYLGRWFARC